MAGMPGGRVGGMPLLSKSRRTSSGMSGAGGTTSGTGAASGSWAAKLALDVPSGAELSLFDAESGDDGLPLASPPEAGLFGGRAPIHADGGAPRGMSGRAGKVKPHGGPLAAVGCSLRQAL